MNMTENKYAYQGFQNDHMARAIGKDLSISTKVAIEVCSFLRGKRLSRAKDIMNNVLSFKEAIPYKRFTDGVGHRPGKMGAGRYPQKAAKAFLDLLGSVEANAQVKGLNTSDLVIVHICANKAHEPMHQGRQRRRALKRSHVEVIVKEGDKAGQKSSRPTKKDSKKDQDKDTKQSVQSVQSVKKDSPAPKPNVPKKEETGESSSAQRPADIKPV